jgi:hypothetical protein
MLLQEEGCRRAGGRVEGRSSKEENRRKVEEKGSRKKTEGERAAHREGGNGVKGYRM